MYNRILKRPMFKRGGPSYQSQGTGITSPYDVPRGGYYGGGTIGGGMIHGNPMGNRTGFEEPRTKEDVQVDIESLVETPKGTWLDDVIGSFGAYSTPYKDDGSAKTIGEMGAEQAASITQIRKDRKDKQDLAKLSGYERELEDIKTAEAQANEMAILKQKHTYDQALEQIRAGNLEFERMIKNERKRADEKIAALDPDSDTYEKDKAAIEAEFQNVSKQIIRGTPGMTELIQGAKDRLYKLHTTLITSTGSSYLQDDLDKWNAQNPGKEKTITEWIQEQAIADVAGTTAAAGLLIQQSKARGGRVGYQLGTPQTGAMPIQASATETIDTPTADFTETQTVTEGQQASVQMPYQEFRAALPAEVNDEIVQLIYYNQDAFADFAQISTQADVYAFNNKYGVSLVLPMDTETT
jgi:hypothetical protein